MSKKEATLKDENSFRMTDKGRMGTWLMAKWNLPFTGVLQMLDDPTFKALCLKWLMQEGLISNE